MSEFVPIPGYPDYFINRDGNVYSKKFNRKIKGRSSFCTELSKMKGTIDNQGYRKFQLNGKMLFGHRLVGYTFIPNPENKPQINHINGIKTDNRVENLEWCTQTENMQHAKKMGLNFINMPDNKGEKNGMSKLNQFSVAMIDLALLNNLIPRDISNAFNISISIVTSIKNGYAWSHITGREDIRKPKVTKK